MHCLKELLINTISSGLKRKMVKKRSVWAENYRMMGKPYPGQWTFDHHPWLREMHDDESEMKIGQKSAQMGYTETALNLTFSSIDLEGVSVLYVLPAAHPDASDFSTARFDPALEASPHLQDMFSDVKNIGHKRAGNANLYVRGSRSRSQLKSIPVGMIILDEVDEMQQNNIPMIFERMAGQEKKESFLLSTPTIDNFGINAYFKNSTVDHFFFACPHCGKSTELIFPECLEITAEAVTDPKIVNTYIVCKECKKTLDHNKKQEFLKNGVWVSSHPDRLSRGFYINQLYSMTVKPWELAASYIKAQSNPSDEQEFYNSKLGQTHVIDGARVTEEDINNRTGGIKQKESASQNALVTLGIDVGTWLHYEIDQWHIDDSILTPDINLKATARLLKAGKCLHFEELDQLMYKYHVNFCVIDANPERRKALEFAQRFWGSVRLCFYGNGVNGKTIHLHDEDQHTMTVDRTTWLDLSLGRFRKEKQNIRIPMDVSLEYKANLKALVRVYQKDRLGNPVGRYIRGCDDDHYAHARNYSEIALALASGNAVSQDIEGVI